MQELKVSYFVLVEVINKLAIYYINNGESYTVFAVSDDKLIICDVFGADISNFEINYKSKAVEIASVADAIVLGMIANKTPFIAPRQDDKAALVALVGTQGSETIWATHNFCDRTTWFGQSQRITEVLSNSGDSLTFSGSHSNWIDMMHGKVFDEDSLSQDVEHGYKVEVIVNNITMSMLEPLFESVSGTLGDYFVTYNSGSITFKESVTSSVTCSYSYENGSVWYLAPSAGKALDIEQAEVQFSKNVEFNDSIHFGIFGPVDIFAPNLLESNGGPLPSGYMIKLEDTKYKTLYQMIDEALGSYPMIPNIGGTGNRGMKSEIYGFPFTYNAVRRLDSRYGLELRVFLEHNIALGGDRGTGTFYCISKNVSDLE